jgi:hypothetical protein
LAALASVLLASSAWAQAKSQPGLSQQIYRPGVPQTPWFSPAPIRQQVFKINDDQFSKLNQAYSEAWARYNKSIGGLDATLSAQQRADQMRTMEQDFFKNFNTASTTILTDAEQRQRFDQLNWQWRGFGAFQDPTVVQRLNLTKEQLARLNEFNQQWTTQMSDLGPMFTHDRLEAQRRFEKMQGDMGTRINTVSTPEQLQTWRQMTGPPYAFPSTIYFPPSK